MDAVAEYLQQGDADYDTADGSFLLRGLEAELPNVKCNRKLLKLIARKEVMKVQYLQHAKQGSLWNVDALARAYSIKSQQSVDLAIAAAAQDEVEAQRCYQQGVLCEI